MPTFDAMDDALLSLIFGPITDDHLAQYAEASGDFNPLHTDPASAQTAGFPDVIAHGMFVMGLAGRLLGDCFGPTSVQQLHMRFHRPTLLGDTLTCTAHITARHAAVLQGELQVGNQQGELQASGSFEAGLGDDTKQ